MQNPGARQTVNTEICIILMIDVYINVFFFINSITSIQIDGKVKMSNIIEPMKFKFKKKAANSTTTSNTDTNGHQQTINSFFKVGYKLIQQT